MVVTGAVLVLLIGLLIGFAAFWTERLWFVSLGYTTVFNTLIWTKIGLFAVFGTVMAILTWGNMLIAYRARPVLVAGDRGGMDRYRAAAAPMRGWMMLLIAAVVGIFTGTSAAGQWRSYLLWRNGGSFGETDPYFGRDVGFYIFTLPWLHFLVDFVLAVSVVGLLAAGAVHYLYGGIRLNARRDRFSPAAQAQLSLLLGFFVLGQAANYWLGRYDLLTDSGRLITGMTYTDDHAVLPARNILMGIALICALLFFLNVWRRTWTLPSLGLVLLVLSGILLGMIWPGIVQRFQVRPSEADKEAPYIQRNIDATRRAYAIDDVEETPYRGTLSSPEDQLRQEAVKAGIRLVDPALVSETFEQKQQVKGYYAVEPVLDVDRYIIDGSERDLVIAARELDQSGIPQGSQNWANLHTVYTHGYGLIAAFGNQRDVANDRQTGDGDLSWAEENIPPTGVLSDLAGPDGYRGQIYFGEQARTYSIVGQPPGGSDIELDLPGGSDGQGTEQKSTYTGEAGVPIGGLWRKLLYAIRFSDANIVLSSRVHENSRIIYDREPLHMVEKVAPWLTVDQDPFPAMVDGRIVWVLDGYTTSDAYPLSQSESFETMTDDSLGDDSQFRTLPTDEINYLRNAVKATVDAYDGTVTLYAWDQQDPMLKAWMSAFPGTVRPRAEIPTELLPHLRYPEDQFQVQRYQLAKYHVTNAAAFYNGNDFWEVPADPNSAKQLQPPYRLSITPPGGTGSPVFSLTSVYTPANRDNLAAFVSVDADAADPEGYGTFRVLSLRSGAQVPGPAQMANNFQGDQGLKDALLAYTNNDTTTAKYGNLLTLPIGDGLMYVQPIYTIRTGGEGNYPLLRFVVVSFGKDVGFGATMDEAIADILGEDTPPVDPGDPIDPPLPPDDQPTGTLNQEVARLLRLARDKFNEADRLQRRGDTAGWAAALEEARDYVDQAIRASAKAEKRKRDRSQ